MEKATVRNLKDIKGKRVFIRVDHNVPQDKKDPKKITDETRIRESICTIRYCLDKGARVILCTHLGRPKEKGEEKFSVKPIVKKLQEYLEGTKITYIDDSIGSKVEAAVNKLKDGEILYLENIRFYPEESANDPEFAKKLANLCDYYINDAFGTAHRAHASTVGIAKFVPAVSGFLMEKELKILGEAIARPKRPMTVILAGAKIADKMPVLNNVLKLADNILIGGGMTYTFVKAQGGEIGNSIVDNSKLNYCLGVIQDAKARKVNLVIGMDTVAGDEFSPTANTRIFDTDKIRDGWEGLDIGPRTIQAFKDVIAKSGTVIQCGSLGVTEFEKFAKGSYEVINAIADSNAITIAGGGDTAFSVAQLGLQDKFTHISTGGSATLELLEGKTLPGVAALLDISKIVK